MKKKCRIWLPKQLESADDLTQGLLFGWFICHSPSCLDVVVAFISDESSLLSSVGSKLQGLLHETNQKMPSTLRDKAAFTLLGRYDISLNANRNSSKITTGKNVCSNGGVYGSPCRHSSLSCGFDWVDGSLEDFRKEPVSNYWIQ